MARNIKPGESRNGYVFEVDLNTGAFAKSWRAKKGGTTVFLKHYKSPSPKLPWYRGYLTYQAEIKKRIQTTPAKGFCYEFIEFFEAAPKPGKTNEYFQAFEWIEGGQDLSHIIEKLTANRNAYSWEQRQIWAKVIMGSISALHEKAGVIHTDLKPENLILIPDESVAVKWRLKLIDFDFAVVAGKKAPWHDHGVGYVGTPGWFSPEHFSGMVPTKASDVFTCGLILYALLAQGNPYFGRDGKPLNDEEYKAAIDSRKAPRPKLEGSMPKGNDAEVEDIIFRCISPNLSDRPTAKEVNQVLIGKRAKAPAAPAPRAPAAPTPRAPVKPIVKPASEPRRTAPRSSPEASSENVALTLTNPGGELRFNISTKIRSLFFKIIFINIHNKNK